MEFIDFKPEIIPDRSSRLSNLLLDDSLSSKILYTPNGWSLTELLHEAGEFLQKQTISEGYILYVFDEVSNEISLYPKKSTKTFQKCHYTSWKVENGKTLAVYVFKSKHTVIVDSNKASVDFVNFPKLQDIPLLQPKHIMALPITNDNQRCFGTLELYKDSKNPYNESDQSACELLLGICARAMVHNETAIYYENYNQIQNKLFRSTEKNQYETIKNTELSIEFLAKILQLAQTVFGAESAVIFIEKDSQLVRIFEVTNKPSDNHMNSRLPIERSYMLSTPFQRVNAEGASQQRGFIHLYKKPTNTNKEFSFTDRQIIEVFGKYATIWMYLENLRAVFKHKTQFNELLSQYLSQELEHFELISLTLDTGDNSIVPVNFKSLDYIPELPDISASRILTLSYHAIWNLCGNRVLPLHTERMQKFISVLRISHIDDDPVPNLCSSFLETHAVYFLLSGCANLFEEYEIFSIMLASLCGQISVGHLKQSERNSKISSFENTYIQSLLYEGDNSDGSKRFWIIKILLDITMIIEDFFDDTKNEIIKIIEELMTSTRDKTQKLTHSNFQRMVRLVIFRFGCLIGRVKLKNSISGDDRSELLSYIDLLKPICPSIVSAISESMLFREILL